MNSGEIFPFWAFIAEMPARRQISKHGFPCSANMTYFVNFTHFPLPNIVKSGAKVADFEGKRGHIVFLAFLSSQSRCKKHMIGYIRSIGPFSTTELNLELKVSLNLCNI